MVSLAAGELPPAHAWLLRRHLRGCDACRRDWEETRAVWDGLREMASEPVREAVGRRVGATLPDLSFPPLLAVRPEIPAQPRVWWVALGAAGAVVVLAVFGLAITRREQTRAARPQASGIAQQPLRIARRAPLAPMSTSARPAWRRIAARPGSLNGAAAQPGQGQPLERGTPLARAAAFGSQRVRRWSAALERQLPVDSGDLVLVNGHPAQDARRWASLPAEAWGPLEARLRRAIQVGDDFVRIPFPRLASAGDQQIAGAVESYKREAAVVDPRLAREVTLEQKATALSDLCDRLRADTGIQVAAGPSVADEKVTVFCEKLPLRDVMRQLARPFGYTWLRSGLPSPRGGGAGGRGYKYELVQDLRSQLLEEELRNRDRNAALLALDREMERYRQYLGLSPDEALARSKTAAPEEKKLLENLAQYGWGSAQMYFRLSARDLATLRAGQEIAFSADPGSGEQPLPPDVSRGVLQSLRDMRIGSHDGRFTVGGAKDVPDGLAPAAVPDASARVTLRIDRSELGQCTLDGGSGIRISRAGQTSSPSTSVGLAVGMSPAARDPGNRAASARLAGDPSLRAHVTMRPKPSCGINPSPQPPPRNGEGESLDVPAVLLKPGHPSPLRGGAGGEVSSTPKVTTADVLQALHEASGLPVVADYYTRLYSLGAVSVRDQPLLEALNRLADAMRLRWSKEGAWLRFRSTSFYDDRLKEVPNRLLARWSASRRQHGALTLDDLIEIAQLSDAQLDSGAIAEGVKECSGLLEWDLVWRTRNGEFRPHLRYLGELTPAQRQAATSPAGLAFNRMSLSQQQQFIALLGPRIRSLGELATAGLRVEYTQPGWFQWDVPEGPAPSPVRERSREATLLAARRIDPQVDAAQIVPTELAVTVLYTWGDPQTRGGSLGMRVTPHYTRRRADSFPTRS